MSSLEALENLNCGTLIQKYQKVDEEYSMLVHSKNHPNDFPSFEFFSTFKFIQKAFCFFIQNDKVLS